MPAWEFESITRGKQPQRTPGCSELAAAELCLLLLGTAKPKRRNLLSASTGKELVARSTPPCVLSSEETGHSDGKRPTAGVNLQWEEAGVVALGWPRFPPWRFGCLITQQDAEDRGMCCISGRKPTAFQLESMGRRWGGQEGQGASGWLLHICPSPTAPPEPEGGRRVSAGP